MSMSTGRSVILAVGLGLMCMSPPTACLSAPAATELPTEWVVVSPGRLSLPGTKYEIRWSGKNSPQLWWNGEWLYSHGSVEEAKGRAVRHARELADVGLTP